MTEKTEHQPFSMLWMTDPTAVWQKSLKPMVSKALETNEKLSKEVLARYEQAMTWTKDTPFAPLCKTFMTSLGKMVENANSLARSTWHIESARDGPETMSK